MRKTKCQSIINLIEEISPKKLAESWDNVGLLIGDGSQEVKKVMVCLDIPDWVIEEAIEQQVDLIISHHPIIFSNLKKINTDSVLGRKIIKLIKNNISVYVAHTNYDMAKGGLNDIFAQAMGFENSTILEPIQFGLENESTCGLGRIADLKNSTTLAIYADHIKKQLCVENVRIAGDLNKGLKRIALINGSGGKYIHTAKFAGADLLVTGDVSYHEMLDAVEMGLCIIDAGHYSTEKMMVNAVSAYLIKRFDELNYNVEVIKSKTNNDPIIIV